MIPVVPNVSFRGQDFGRGTPGLKVSGVGFRVCQKIRGISAVGLISEENVRIRSAQL